MKTTTWSELSSGQRRAIAIVGATEAVLTTVALWDLARRRSKDVRGPKAAWLAASFLQPIGPVAYLVKGRRRA